MNSNTEKSNSRSFQVDGNSISSTELSLYEEKLRHLEQHLKDREASLRRKEVQVECVLHDVSKLTYQIQHHLLCLTIENDRLRNLLDYLFTRLHNILGAYLLFSNPSWIENDLSSPRNVFLITKQICSRYSPIINIHIHICGESSQEFMLNHYVELAISFIIDHAITNSPDDSDLFVSFAGDNDGLTVEFKYLEPSVKRSYKKGFGSNIIWNPEDEDVALHIFENICNSNDIGYHFVSGEEKKEFNGDLYLLSVVTMTFSSKHR